MSSNYIDIKNRLQEYLERRGIRFDQGKKTYQCPMHQDDNPSAVIYRNKDGHVLYCPVCSKTIDIFSIAGILNGYPDSKDFKKQIESVCQTLGIPVPEKNINKNTWKKNETKTVKKKVEPVALPKEKADKIYTASAILEIAKKRGWGNIVKTWPFRNIDSDYVALDVRFEGGEKKKEVITFWYDGKLRWSDTPIFIYNIHLITQNPNAKFMIHEGAHKADLGNEKLKEWIHIAWNGGSGKAHLADWSILKEKEVFFCPDDDQQIDKRTNKLWPEEKQPGIKAAFNVKQQLPHLKIIKPVLKAREIKTNGADIVEILQVLTPEEYTLYALNPENHLKDIDKSPGSIDKPSEGPSHPPTDPGDSSMPFKILGIGEGEAHFIDEWGYYQRYKLDSLTKGKLLNLCGLYYWSMSYPAKGGANWDGAIDEIIVISKAKYFNTKCLRGKGAWKSGNKICYNDGQKIYGEKDDNLIYLKDLPYDCGLDNEPAKPELLKRLKEILFDLSFETRIDAIRVMGWTVLAPFCGALEYRPTILMTGESGHGKTKVQTLVIKKISGMRHLDMRTTSEAGIRREIDKNSMPIFFDEAGKETDKMKINHESIIAYIRSSYSDDAADGVKANVHTNGTVTYKNFSMFGIATTDPTIENIQDENRILRVNFIKPKHTAREWQKISDELITLLDENNCKAIRSLTWKNLKVVISLAKDMVQIAREKSKRDTRSSHADMLLAAAYMVIWCGVPEPTTAQINDMLDKYYTMQPVEENRSESEEFISEMFNAFTEVHLEDKNIRQKISISECIKYCYELYDETEKKPYRMQLSRLGLVVLEKNIGIANDSKLISDQLKKPKGFNKILRRHKGYMESKTLYSPHDQVSRRYTIIKDVFEAKEGQMKFEEMDIPI